MKATYRDVFADRRYRVLFGSRTLAITADTLRIVALSTLVFAQTGSPLLSALTFGIGFVPQVIGGSLFGALADRVPPRRLISTGYALEFGAALLLSVLPPAGSLAVVAMVGALTPVFNGASSRLSADLLTGDVYVLARSLSNMAASAAQLLGLAAGAATVAAIGPHNALLVCAGAHLVACLSVRLRLPDFPLPVKENRTGVVRQTWTGNRDLLANRVIRRLLLAQWLPPAFIAGAEGLVVVYAADRGFPLGSAGWLLAGLPVGMLCGQFVVGTLLRPALRERLVAPLVILLGLPLLALPAGPPLPVAAGLLVVVGAGFAYGLGLQRAFLDALPDDLRGQAFGLLGTGVMTLQGLGPAAFGLLAEFIPTAWAMATAGLLTITVGGWLVILSARSVRYTDSVAPTAF